MRTRIVYFVLISAFFFTVSAGKADAEQAYIVKKGDTLYRIYKKFRVEPERIMEANNLDSSILIPGKRLVIPTKKSAADSQATVDSTTGAGAAENSIDTHSVNTDADYHTVKKGETISSIAKKYAISADDLKEINNIKKTRRLKAGQKLLVKRTGPRTYTVRKGDNIWKIAKRFDITAEDLKDINELQSDELKAGQRLIVEEPSEESGINKYNAMLFSAISAEDIKALSESPDLKSLSLSKRVVLFSKKMLDIPYRFGGSSLMGIDCSGYVQKVFGLLDIPLPRTAREQFHIGEPVDKANLNIGDLVFFRTYASFPSHVGIYLGDNLFIHASSKARRVSIDSLDTPFYIKRFIGAKRIFDDEDKGGADSEKEG